jgi:beta-1,4-N-acetylglucosaminyltransferase
VMSDPLDVLYVCSSGGHLDQLLPVIEAGPERHLVATFPTVDALSRVPDRVFLPLYYPTNRRVWNNLRNLWLAFAVMRARRPRVLISAGAAPSVSFGAVAFLLRTPHLYIEPVDRLQLPTLTAKLLRVLPNTFFAVQWDSQLQTWPRRLRIERSR